MKIKMSKSQWEGIGVKAGWMKEAGWGGGKSKCKDCGKVYLKKDLKKDVCKKCSKEKGVSEDAE